MNIDVKIKDKILKYDINREAVNIKAYQMVNQIKLTNMNFSQLRKYFHLMKVEK